MMAIGDGGMAGRRSMGGGRRFGLEGRSKDVRFAVAGGGGRLKDIFHTGAEGRARNPGTFAASV